MPKSQRLSKLLSSASGPLGGSPEQPFHLTNPMLVMFEQGDRLICHIHPREQDSYKSYALIVCDLVRHLAGAFKVDEDDVWKWVEMERENPTTDVRQHS